MVAVFHVTEGGGWMGKRVVVELDADEVAVLVGATVALTHDLAAQACEPQGLEDLTGKLSVMQRAAALAVRLHGVVVGEGAPQKRKRGRPRKVEQAGPVAVEPAAVQ